MSAKLHWQIGLISFVKRVYQMLRLYSVVIIGPCSNQVTKPVGKSMAILGRYFSAAIFVIQEKKYRVFYVGPRLTPSEPDQFIKHDPNFTG